jgi:hypothetical protein
MPIMKDWKLYLLFFISLSTVKGQASLFDTLSFENSLHQSRISFDSTQSSGIWQIGAPQKVLFDSAHSEGFAMITDTTLLYSAGTSDTFSLAFDIYGAITTIEFKHRYNLDSLHAYGNIEISADSGNSWHLLHDTIDSFGFLYQITNFHGPYGTVLSNFYTQHKPNSGYNGFTGHSKGWETSIIEFPCFAIKRPWEVYLRFNFFADSAALPGEGWMIDDIIISSFGGCSSLKEKHKFPIIDIFPNPNYEQNIMLSKPWDKSINFDLYNINGQLHSIGIIAAFGKTIPLLNIKSGLYSLHFYDDQTPIGFAKFQKK